MINQRQWAGGRPRLGSLGKLLVVGVLLLLTTGCQLQRDRQFTVYWDGWQDLVIISGRASSEIRWQFETECTRQRVCMAEGIRATDWDFDDVQWEDGIDGEIVKNRLARIFDGNGVEVMMDDIPWDGSVCIVLGAGIDTVGLTNPGEPLCPYGESLTAG